MFPFLAKVELPDISKTQDLGQFIGDVYTFAITIVGVLVFVVFLWAGWLYLTAAGNAGNVGKAKTMMTNAIVGAIILLSAYLILYVINPDLVENTFNFKLPAAGPATGLNYSPSDKLKLIDLAPSAGKAKDPVTAIFQSGLTGIKVLWDGTEISANETSPGQIIFNVPDNAAAGDHKIALKAGNDVSNELVFKVGTAAPAGGGPPGDSGGAPPADGGAGGTGGPGNDPLDLPPARCYGNGDLQVPGHGGLAASCSCENGTITLSGGNTVSVKIDNNPAEGCDIEISEVCRVLNLFCPEN